MGQEVTGLPQGPPGGVRGGGGGGGVSQDVGGGFTLKWAEDQSTLDLIKVPTDRTQQYNLF